jgi:signal transduction histidine kinase
LHVCPLQYSSRALPATQSKPGLLADKFSEVQMSYFYLCLCVSFFFISLFCFVFYFISFHFLHIILFRFVLVDFVWFSLVSFHFVSISLISFRFVSFSLISFRFVSFRFYFVSHFICTLAARHHTCLKKKTFWKSIATWSSIVMRPQKRKRNETKRNEINENETKRNEINEMETKWNETNENQTKSTKTKRNRLIWRKWKEIK